MEYKRINRNGVKTLGKTWVLFCLFAMMSLNVHAQDMKFGYFSYQEVFTSMSSYALAQQNIQELKSKYEAETKRSEDEFNQKYEDFLEGMQNYAPTILKKRQAELQDFINQIWLTDSPCRILWHVTLLSKKSRSGYLNKQKKMR